MQIYHFSQFKHTIYSNLTLALKLTVYDVALLDLLKNLRPDIGVALFICCDSRGLEVHDLGEAAGLRLSHDEMFNIEIEFSLESEQDVRKKKPRMPTCLLCPSRSSFNPHSECANPGRAWHLSTCMEARA